MKPIFIITSSICSNLHSFYTKNERFNQTMLTIDSIRKLGDFPILFIDNSDISDYKESIIKEVDIFDNPLGNPSKSGGEILLVTSALKHIANSGLDVDMIYKISGRYYLNDRFSLINDTRIRFRRFNLCVSTVLYSFGRDKIDTIIEDFGEISKNVIYKDIEHTTYDRIKNRDINWIDYWGVVGNRSPDGSFLEH